MKFLHLSDLHLGKSIYGVSLIDEGDQRHLINEILKCAASIQPQAVVIAGDVYDRSAPSGEAVQLLSQLITSLVDMGIEVLIVSGNHDSAQRLSFAGDLLSRQGIHISPSLSAGSRLTCVPLRDEHGPVNFWLMPYVYPALVEQVLEIQELRDYDSAVRALLADQSIDFSQRNVLIAHQNVTANGVESQRGGSESMVGGVGQVDYTAFDGFDYVALGHIHAGYPVGRETVRYAGTPMCYHFDETRQSHKGPLLVELGEKGAPIRIEPLNIPPLHPMRNIAGSFPEIMEAEKDNPARGEYLKVTLTDSRDPVREWDALKALFDAHGSQILERGTASRTASEAATVSASASAVKEKPIDALFGDYYESATSQAPDAAVRSLLAFASELLEHADPHNGVSEQDVERLLAELLKGANRL